MELGKVDALAPVALAGSILPLTVGGIDLQTAADLIELEDSGQRVNWPAGWDGVRAAELIRRLRDTSPMPSSTNDDVGLFENVQTSTDQSAGHVFNRTSNCHGICENAVFSDQQTCAEQNTNSMTNRVWGASVPVNTGDSSYFNVIFGHQSLTSNEGGVGVSDNSRTKEEQSSRRKN